MLQFIGTVQAGKYADMTDCGVFIVIISRHRRNALIQILSSETIFWCKATFYIQLLTPKSCNAVTTLLY